MSFLLWSNNLYPDVRLMNFISTVCSPPTKGEVKVVPVLLTEHDAMNLYWGSGGRAPIIL